MSCSERKRGTKMSFFDGLYPYEVAMLVAGTLMFLALLFAFVFYLVKAKPLSKLLPFFVIPILMIGFPSIKSFRLQGDLIVIEKMTRQVEQNPADKSSREQLAGAVQRLSVRPLSNPKTLTAMAHAQLLLGDDTSARTTLDKALKADPNSAEARQLKKRIDLVRDLDRLIPQVEKNPADAAAKAELLKKVGEVTESSITSPETLVRVARAQAALGQKAQALSTIDKALIINPNSAEAIRLRSQIKAVLAQPTANSK
jgi:tetratricopeptide (TPR) repeat protein